MRIQLQPWQTSALIGICGMLTVGATLAITNPHRNAYQNYAAGEVRSYLQEEACGKFFGHFLEQQCRHFVKTSQPYLTSAVNLSTRRHNYVLFSIYQTQLSLGNGFPAYSAKTVGFLNCFWTYESGLKIAESASDNPLN